MLLPEDLPDDSISGWLVKFNPLVAHFTASMRDRNDAQCIDIPCFPPHRETIVSSCRRRDCRMLLEARLNAF